jgi:uncharacterized protein
MAIVLTPKTTIGTLLDEHPFLLKYLSDYHPSFGKLTNPVARRTVGRFATVERAAEIASVPVDKLLADIAAMIAAETGAKPRTGATAGAGVDPLRQEELKAIIRDLHAGRTPDEVKPRFEELIKDIEATEIAAMEQALIAGGVPDTEVKRLCDVHMKVFQDALEENKPLNVPAGHPVDTFQRENRAVGDVTRAIRAATARLSAGDTSSWPKEKPGLAASADRLGEFEKHHIRKENQLFPFLEKHAVEGPSKVMWALDDDIRALTKEFRQAVAADDAPAALKLADELTTMVDDMVNKEEKVLFPMALDVLSDEEWRQIRAGEDEIGFALVAEVAGWPAGESGAAADAAAPPALSADLLALRTGALTLEQLNLMLSKLPVDVTFVDENDEVRFYSEGERVFPRSPAVIGRKVQNCHPSSSVYKVQEIVDAFRAGEKDVAEFWITINGRFVHIRYFALRDAAGAYRGVLEVTQDATAIRSLEGERRLIEW